MKQIWVIENWAGNLMTFGKFDSFEDAEEFLCEKLGDNYSTDRCEYEIVRKL